MRFLQRLILAALSVALVIAGIACTDDKPPVISEISVSDLTATTASINWKTNERATSQVSYGLNVPYSNTFSGTSAVTTTHSVTLNILNSGVTYHYRVESTDASGNQSTSGDQAFDTPWIGPNGETVNENVTFEGAIIVGADGHDIALTNNPKAHDPTWAELKQFLSSDQTDRIPYNDSTFVCGDFAERLHNKAENAGIRTAYVCIKIGVVCHWVTITENVGYRQCGFLETPILHACNAFETKDKGLVYVDDTGTENGLLNADKSVNITVGQDYTPISIFSNPSYEDTWDTIGQVSSFQVTW